VSLYAALLLGHSYVRWAVLGSAALAIVRSLWVPGDERAHRAFIGLLDLQLLLGLGLYFVASPIIKAFYADPAHALKVPGLRFFALDHAVMMIVAVAVAHVGRARARRAADAKRRQRTTTRFTALSLAILLATVPWPFLRYGRPLARGLPSSPVLASCPPSYAARCVTCHGERGAGDGPAAGSLRPPPRNFGDAAWAAARTDAQLAAVIHDGGVAHGLGPAMPAQSDLSREELEALVSCVRSFSAR
jgi:hypothetical protein